MTAFFMASRRASSSADVSDDSLLERRDFSVADNKRDSAFSGSAFSGSFGSRVDRQRD
jgi:hypothetical protein